MEEADIDNPEIVAQVRAALAVYEDALARSDAAVLEHVFWSSDKVVRFGAKENVIGMGDIRTYRAARLRTPRPRTTLSQTITTFGQDLATVSILFERETEPALIGRWTQTWVRLGDDWRIVAAHVSAIGKPDAD